MDWWGSFGGGSTASAVPQSMAYGSSRVVLADLAMPERGWSGAVCPIGDLPCIRQEERFGLNENENENEKFHLLAQGKGILIATAASLRRDRFSSPEQASSYALESTRHQSRSDVHLSIEPRPAALSLWRLAACRPKGVPYMYLTYMCLTYLTFEILCGIIRVRGARRQSIPHHALCREATLP